jgi:arylsulfatase A
MFGLIKNNKIKKIKVITFVLFTVLMSLTSASQDRPNIIIIIIIIMADDLGVRDLAVYGNKFNESPNIDKLASEGMQFNNTYTAPVCSATRASIQSEQYPARVAIFDFIPRHWRPYEEVTVLFIKSNTYQKTLLRSGMLCNLQVTKRDTLENDT